MIDNYFVNSTVDDALVYNFEFNPFGILEAIEQSAVLPLNVTNEIFNLLKLDSPIEIPSVLQRTPGERLKFRITSVSMPENKVETYDYTYQGRVYPHPLPIERNDKTFSFSIRIDKYYAAYRIFELWMKLLKNPIGSKKIQISGNRTLQNTPLNISVLRQPAIIQAYESPKNKIPLFTWTYNNAFPINISAINFDKASLDTNNVTITMAYGEGGAG